MGEEDISDQLFKSLHLDNNEMLRSDPRMLEQGKDLVHEYSDEFSSPEKEIGETSLIEFHVQLKPEAHPVKQKLRPLNAKQKEDMRKQLDLWEKENAIEETESP